MRIGRLFGFAAFGSCFAALLGVVRALFGGVFYRPDAKTSLTLDGVLASGRREDAAEHSRFKAFIERALGHADYTAGHFDPGRMLA